MEQISGSTHAGRLALPRGEGEVRIIRKIIRRVTVPHLNPLPARGEADLHWDR